MAENLLLEVKKNTRVIVKASKNEWFTGHVTRKGSKSISVQFDDGLVAVIDEEDFPDVKVMLVDYRSDEPLTDEEAKRLYWSKKAAADADRKKATRLKIKLDAAPKVELSAQDKKLMTYFKPELFAAAGSRSAAKASKWAEDKFTAFNRDLFKGQLPRPIIVIMGAAEERKLKTNAIWMANKRHLCIGLSVFERDELFAIKALLHVMCHQAVSEIDKRVGNGHDQYWGTWTVKALIPAYTQEGIVTDVPAMLKYEPETVDALPPPTKPVGNRERLTKGLNQFKEPPFTDTPAMLYTASGVWRKGLLLGQYRRDGDVVLLMVPSLDRYKKVPLTDLYETPDDQEALFKTPEWRASAVRVREDLNIKPRLHNINGQVMCSVCGRVLKTPKDIALQINNNMYDTEHAAEYLGMPEDTLVRMVKTRQV